MSWLRALGPLALSALGSLAACRELEIAPSHAAAPSATSSAAAAAPPVGEATLRAEKPEGVPLHAEPRASAVEGRIADGERVHVLERRNDGRWLRVRARDGRSGWITKRYIAPSAKSPPAAASRAPAPESAWASRELCERRVAAGQRSERDPGSARLAAWNLRWFPDGGPGRGAAKRGGTDLDWVACALVFLGADVVALSEIKAHPSARAKLDRVLARAGALGGGEWRVRIDDCGEDAAQHVALAWNARRATAHGFTEHAALNPRGSACADKLRPGLGGYFRFPGGLDLEVVAVHLKSGTSTRDRELRARSLAAVSLVKAEAVRRHRDEDVVILGDFNTMGCARCAPASSADEELAALDARVASQPAPFARVPIDPPCSHYYQGKASLLDLVLAPEGMRELAAGARARASGLCSDLGCGALPAEPPGAHARLSDHCPIAVDLVDRDLDE